MVLYQNNTEFVENLEFILSFLGLNNFKEIWTSLIDRCVNIDGSINEDTLKLNADLMLKNSMNIKNLLNLVDKADNETIKNRVLNEIQYTRNRLIMFFNNIKNNKHE